MTVVATSAGVWRGYGAIGIVLLPPLVGGCTTMLRGTTESIMIDSTPSGAVCMAVSDGQERGMVVTPAVVQVPRSAAPIELHCRAAGFRETVLTLRPVTSIQASGSILLDMPSVLTDAASGSIYEYPSEVNVRLLPETGLIIEDQSSPPPAEAEP